MRRVLLDRAVIALFAIAVPAALAMWLLISWFIEVNLRPAGGELQTEADQRWSEVVFFSTYLVTPGVTAALVASLIGLPIVIGARAAALRRARAGGGAGDTAPTPPRPPSGRP
jgi:hypothetical protein